MSHQLVLMVPDHVHEQAQAMAQRQQQPVELVLVDALHSAFPAWPVHPQREQMRREEAAFEAMREELLVTHQGREVLAVQPPVRPEGLAVLEARARSRAITHQQRTVAARARRP
jgi:hypothetical protein